MWSLETLYSTCCLEAKKFILKDSVNRTSVTLMYHRPEFLIFRPAHGQMRGIYRLSIPTSWPHELLGIMDLLMKDEVLFQNFYILLNVYLQRIFLFNPSVTELQENFRENRFFSFTNFLKRDLMIPIFTERYLQWRCFLHNGFYVSSVCNYKIRVSWARNIIENKWIIFMTNSW